MADQQLVVDNTISSIRSAIFTIGGLLVGAGYLQDNELALWGGIAVNVATVAWLFYRNAQARKKLVSAVQVGQAMPAVQSEQEITAKLNAGQIVIPSTPTQ